MTVWPKLPKNAVSYEISSYSNSKVSRSSARKSLIGKWINSCLLVRVGATQKRSCTSQTLEKRVRDAIELLLLDYYLSCKVSVFTQHHKKQHHNCFHLTGLKLGSVWLQSYLDCSRKTTLK